MIVSMKKVEILAPAGSYESMVAAVSAGADAAYIGGSLFGARAFADNLNEDMLLRAIDYMHLREKKLYLTVNTLLKDEEIEEQLYHYLEQYYLGGLDAVIVQDVGVMKFIHEHFPGLPIHGSTQMTLTMAEGAKVLEDCSVSRIVAARELSLSELRAMKAGTSLEIEAFVHGALCYSYSGQCLMSSLIGGRSGNRGKCAQPCRMPYECEGKEGYLLSPKDMCTLSIVPDLIEAGIDSFKIEGRMKRYEYTAGVTALYRKWVDLYYELGAKGYRNYQERHPKEMEEDHIKLKDLYNRGGFCTGYYKEKNGKSMMSMVRPNHSGVYVGKIKSVTGCSAVIELKQEVFAQDVLEIRTGEKAVYEFTLKTGEKAGRNITANFKQGCKVRAGSEVYRTKNQNLLTGLSKQYYEQEKKIPVEGFFSARFHEPSCINIIRHSENGKCSRIHEEGLVAELAIKQPLTGNEIKEKLRKTNDTPFYFKELTVAIEENLFLPVSALNELRRTALNRMEEALTAPYRRSAEHLLRLRERFEKENGKENDNKAKQEGMTFTVCVRNREQLKAAEKLSGVQDIYLDITDLQAEEIREIISQADKSFFLRLPHIFRKGTYDNYLTYLDVLGHPNVKGYVIRNFEEYFFIMELFGERLSEKELRLDYTMYVMNGEAKKFWSERGISRMSAPLELNEKELLRLDVTDMELLVYGRIPLMVSAQCVLKNTKSCSRETGEHKKEFVLIDRTKKKLPVVCSCEHCFNTIYNPEILLLSECAKGMKRLNPASVRLDFTMEKENEIEGIYKQVWEGIHGKQGNALEKGYTRGHFTRGVM